MKKTLLVFTILFTTIAFSQNQKATLYFKDGKIIEGLAKITAYGNKIKFRKDKKSKKLTYTSKEIESIKIFEKKNAHLFNIKGDLQLVHYYYKKVKVFDSYRLLQILESGKVNLYRDLKEGTNFNNHNGHVTTTSYSISRYYVCKENEDAVSNLGAKGTLFSKNFKKAASEYFKDCNKLVEKIQNKEYKKKDVVDVVKYYNKNCN